MTQRGYLAYLLRLWQVRGEEGMAWRASLESARTGERIGFASLQELFAFLEQEVRQIAQGQTTRNRGENARDIDM